MPLGRDFTFYYVLAFASLPLVSVLVPKMMTFGPVFLGLIGTVYLLRSGVSKNLFNRTYILIAFGIGALACASALSADHPGEVLEKAAASALLILCGVFPLFVASALDRERLKVCAWLIPALLLAAAFLAAAELGLGLPLYKAVHGVVEGQRIFTAVINRGAVNVVLCLFCALAVMQSLGGAEDWGKRMASIAALIAVTGLMLALSQAQVAQLTFILGLVIYALYPAGRWPRVTFAVLAGVSCSILLISPWLAQWMFATLAEDTQDLSWLRSGYAASRMEIWDFTARYALERPLTGHGLDATRYVAAFDHAHLYHREDGVLHPHNFAIQIWVDAGLMGVLPACALLAYLFRHVCAMPPRPGRVAMVTLLMTLLVGAISYGLWQSHWIGVMLYLLALNRLTERLFEEGPNDSSTSQHISSL